MKQKPAECATYETNGISKMAYQGDIVSRLRNWRGLHLSHGGQLYDEAADEIERLRITEEERVEARREAYRQWLMRQCELEADRGTSGELRRLSKNYRDNFGGEYGDDSANNRDLPPYEEQA